MKIPKIIHQIWIGPKPAPKFMHTWKDYHPDYEYVLWDEKKIEKDLFPMINQHIYDLYGKEKTQIWNGRSNPLRYEILHKYGGIYIDADTICLRRLDDFFLEDEIFAAYINEKERGDRIASGVIGCVKNNIVMEKCIWDLNKKTKIERPSFIFVGPVYFTNIVKKYNLNIKLYPSYYFYPNFYDSKGNYKGDFKPYGDHVWGETKGIYGKI